MPGFVVVGGGVAGMRAAERLKDRRPDAEVAVLSEEQFPFYRRPQLGDVAAGRLPETAIYAHPAAYYRSKGIDVRLDSRVTAVDPEACTVRTENGALLHYDGLVVASGRRRARPGIPGSDLPGVVSFTTVDEARQVLSLPAGAEVVVHGDTIPALELVRAAAGRGLAVSYLLSGQGVWPEVLDVDGQQIAANRMVAAGVKVVTEATPVAVVERNGRAGGVRLADGRMQEGALVGLCGRFEPAVDFLPEAGTGLQVAADLSTPCPEVVAAGDACAGGGFNWLRSWRQGEQAADTLLAGLASTGSAGAETAGLASDQVHVFNTQIMGVSLVSVGRTVVAYRSGYSEVKSEVFGDFYKKLVFDPDDRLVGALLLGNVAEAGALEAAVRAGTERRHLNASLLEQLFEPTYAPHFMGVQCPVCRHEIQLEPGATAGDRVTCPICGVEFTLVQGPQGLIARAAG